MLLSHSITSWAQGRTSHQRTIGTCSLSLSSSASKWGSVVYSVISGTGDKEDSSSDDSDFYDSDYTDNNERQRRQADNEDKDIIQTALAPSTVCPVS